MQRFSRMGIVILSLLLVACISHTHQFMQSQVQENLLQEDWQRKVDTDPYKWKKHADNWLWFGTPTAVEQGDRNAPYSQAMSTMVVKVPDFTQIRVNGDFQVQMDGRFQHNSVYLLGPNEEIRQVVVEVKDHALSVHRLVEKNKDPKHVIVRIAIHNLQSLIQEGSGKVEGRFIKANPLTLTSSGSGDVILAGTINAKEINQSGTGSITLLGAYTPLLRIDSSGSGDLNISGRVGVSTIKHSGKGDINIIGADTNSLYISTSGIGKIGIKGVAHLKELTASGDTQVYLYFVKSKSLYVYTNDNAIVGLAGQTRNLYVDAKDSSRFLGRYLHSKYTYVRARGWSHVNTAADERAFAAADDNSSIYIVGMPDVISPYVNDNAVIVPIEPPPETPTQILRYRHAKADRFGTERYLP